MAKGSSFERDIAKYLTKWLTGETKPYMFWRMPASGGLATIHEECVGLSGDIRSVHKNAEFMTSIFAIECKTGYPRTSFWQHFKNIKNFPLEQFWTQTCNEAVDKEPMLIYRKKGNKPIVGISDRSWSKLAAFVAIGNLKCIIMDWGDYNELPRLLLYDMEQFFNMVKPDDIKEMGHQLGVYEWPL